MASASTPLHAPHSIDARLRQQRATNLNLVKSILQPFYDNHVVTREQFIAISKRTLDWIMRHAGLREGATWETVAPLVESQVSALLHAKGAASNSDRRPGDLSRPSPRFDNPVRPDSATSHNTMWKRDSPQAVVADGAVCHVRALMERFFLHDDDDQTVAKSSPPLPLDAEDDRYGATCSSGPIDPEELGYHRRRQQRLANFRQRHLDGESGHSRPSTAPPPAPAFSLDDIAALLETHHRQHAHNVEELLNCMEHRHAVVGDESAARYSLTMDETVERGVVMTSALSSLDDAIARGLRRVQWEEHHRREDVACGALDERCRIADEMSQELAAICEAAEQCQRDLEEAEREALQLPPPPTTPKPAKQFDGDAADDDDTKAGDAAEANIAAAYDVLRRLKAMLGSLSPEQQYIVEQRIETMEHQLQSMKMAHEQSPQLQEKNPVVKPQRTPRKKVPARAGSVSAVGRGSAVLDPYAPPQGHTPQRRKLMAHGVKPFSPGTLRKPLPTPSRAHVIEFIRSLLQPLYDKECLDRDVFVGIVKHVSQTFFHHEGWLRAAEDLLGAEVVQDHHFHPTRQPLLWKVYLHREICEILGDELPL